MHTSGYPPTLFLELSRLILGIRAEIFSPAKIAVVRRGSHGRRGH